MHTDLEKSILTVVQQASGSTTIGVRTNFFEIGIDSVVLVRIHRLLRDALHLEFPLTALFGNPNIRSLAGHLQRVQGDDGAVTTAYERAQHSRDARRRRPRRGDRREDRA